MGTGEEKVMCPTATYTGWRYCPGGANYLQEIKELVAQVSFQCPEHSTASVGSTSTSTCTCLAGFFGPDGGPCEPCPTGTYKNTSGSAAGCTACPRSGQWSPRGSAYADNCIFKASGFSVIDYHGNLLYNFTDEFVSFDSHGNQRWTLVPMDGEGSWQERWKQHQDRVEGWEDELRAAEKRRLEHQSAQEGPRQTLRAQRDAAFGKPPPFKKYVTWEQLPNYWKQEKEKAQKLQKVREEAAKRRELMGEPDNLPPPPPPPPPRMKEEEEGRDL